MASLRLRSTAAKALGAFYTPEAVADPLARWVVQTGKEILLEPSVGDGALIKASLSYASDRWGKDSDVRFFACDIDPRAEAHVRMWLEPKHQLKTTDFFDLQPDQTGLVDGVITNPPFTRNHSLDASYRDELRRRFNLTGAPGLWVPFLFHSCSFLKSGGRLSAVIPASALFTRYGQAALEYIASQFAYFETRRIIELPNWRCKADERGAILLAAGYRNGSSALSKPSLCKLDGNLVHERELSSSTVFKEATLAATRLGLKAKLSIGLVTGSNRTFLLNESERSKLSIDHEDLKHVVSRARQAKGIFLTKENLEKLAGSGEKTWLLHPSGVDRDKPGVRNRLSLLTASERKQVVWLKKRPLWWKVDVGPECDAVFTYMNHFGPRLTLCERGILCTNTLHRVVFDQALSVPQRIGIAVSMIGTFGQLAAETIGRTYGGGILKFELHEVRSLPVLGFEVSAEDERLNHIQKAFEASDFDLARRIADKILLPKVFGSFWQRCADDMYIDLQRKRSLRMISRGRGLTLG